MKNTKRLETRMALYISGVICGVITVRLAGEFGPGASITIFMFCAALICFVAPAVIKDDPEPRVIDGGKLNRDAFLKGVARIQDLQADIDRETDRIAIRSQLSTLSDEDLQFMIDECPSSVLRFRIVRELMIREGKTE